MNKILLIALLLSIVFTADIPTAEDDKVQNLSGLAAYKGDWYSGNLDIGNGNIVHYWFFKTFPYIEGQPVQIWLSNGPGCSSLIDATGGNGPFNFADKDATQTFNMNENSWNLNANMLYLDAPGVGYSVRAEQADDYEGDTDNQTVQFFYEALLKWYERFDEYKDEDLFIGGSGYGGNYAALLTEKILLLNQNQTISQKIQIRGLITGNSVVTQSQVEKYYKEFPYNFVYFMKHMGIIGWDEVMEFQDKCGADANDFREKSDECKSYVKIIKKKTYGLNLRDINADCALTDLGGVEYDCTDDDHIDEWFNTQAVRKQLHVSDKAGQFRPCNLDQKHKDGYGSLFVYPTLIKAGLRIWTYTGDADAKIPFNSTIKWIQTLRNNMGLSDIVSHSSWFYTPDDKKERHIQNGGGYWRMDGLTYVSFRSCGQDVSKCNPEGSQQMYKAFINREEMEMDPFKPKPQPPK